MARAHPGLKLLERVLLGLVFLGLAGCDRGLPPLDDVTRSPDRPSMTLTAAEAVTGYDAQGRPVFSLLDEEQILEGVTRTGGLRLTFDRFLAPTAAIRQAICVRPALENLADASACRDPVQAFTRPEEDPVHRRVTFRLPAGQRYLPETAYRVTVFASTRTDDGSVSVDDNAFRAFDGAPLERRYAFDFTTQGEDVDDDTDEIAPSPEAYCAAIDCFRACADDAECRDACRTLCLDDTCFGFGDLLAPSRPGRDVPAVFETCATSGCHGGPTDALALGLDLSSRQAVARTRGRVARQTQTGADADLPRQNPRPFGRSMPLVDPSQPANSYLLYKPLIHPLNHVVPPPRDELDRLRAAAVVGLPMPTGVTGPGRGMVPDDVAGSLALLERLRLWIASGAVVSCP